MLLKILTYGDITKEEVTAFFKEITSRLPLDKYKIVGEIPEKFKKQMDRESNSDNFQFIHATLVSNLKARKNTRWLILLKKMWEIDFFSAIPDTVQAISPSETRWGGIVQFKPKYNFEEVTKAIIHELGHSFDLKHCTYQCVMKKPTITMNFCKICKEKLNQSV